jgi:hypothetical protein
MKKLTAENKKHIKIVLIIWVIVVFFVVLFTGLHNIIWALLLGLIYIGYYILSILGFNPIMNGLKIFWNGGDSKNDDVEKEK